MEASELKYGDIISVSGNLYCYQGPSGLPGLWIVCKSTYESAKPILRDEKWLKAATRPTVAELTMPHSQT